MNKKILIFGGIALLIILIIGIFVFMPNTDEVEDTNTEDPDDQNQAPEDLDADLENLDQLDSDLDEEEPEIIDLE